MRIFIPVLAAAMLAGCASNAPRVYSSPAPAGALECALRTMAGLGYNPIQGGVADGYVKFDRFRGTNTGQRAAAIIPGVGRPTDGDYILVAHAANTLRISVSAYKMVNGSTRTFGPSSEALGHAEALAATCAPPSTQNSGNPGGA
ncbi:MAG TPA: hypothetical protein VGC13_12720 [Longimicrobium sp.]|jgi:hypothetical protein|uniref:hypothetical protein n=1 Tax=Longimicrobium sp. TaxID=2029185 RepID=UPI002ED8FC1A